MLCVGRVFVSKVITPESPDGPQSEKLQILKTTSVEYSNAPATSAPAVSINDDFTAPNATLSFTEKEHIVSKNEAFEIELIRSDTSSTPIATSSRDALIHKPDIARAIAQQIAQAAPQEPNKPIELVLSPEELGRVRLTLSPAENGITMSILAERPETLEIMRRNIDALAQDFHEMGYENTSFSFAQSGSNHSSSDQDTTDHKHSPRQQSLAIQIDAPAAQPMRIANQDRVDYRI